MSTESSTSRMRSVSGELCAIGLRWDRQARMKFQSGDCRYLVACDRRFHVKSLNPSRYDVVRFRFRLNRFATTNHLPVLASFPF